MNKALVGEKIKKARVEKSLSQEDLAEKIGVSRMMVSRYELGNSEVSIENLQKISKVLEKTISYFFGEEPDQGSKEIWKEAQKYLSLMKERFGDKVSLTPKEMLAFSLGEGADIKEAVEEARTLMKNWYVAHNLEKSTNKSFDEWWEDKK